MTPVVIGVVVVILFSASAISPSAPGTILRVDADATGTPVDGSTWTRAYRDLQNALAAATSGGFEIWVAEGTYKPTTGPDRTATFQLLNDVALYGGFDGTETSRKDRNCEDNKTILSGDLNGDDDETWYNRTENSYHVVTGSGTDKTAVLDGFSVSGGFGGEPGSPDPKLTVDGGGMYNINGSPTVGNCVFSDNAAKNGGGMYNHGSDPEVTECTFSSNDASLYGGGMHNYESSPRVTDCTFTDNYANFGGGMCSGSNSGATVDHCTFSDNRASDGGGMANYLSDLTVMNSAFYDNMVVLRGGGMFNSSGSPVVTNCTFLANFTYMFGGGMFNNWSSPMVTNCTFSGNRAVGYGAGMDNDHSSPTVTSCTFFENEWDGMVNESGSKPTVRNTILAGSEAHDCSGSLASGGHNLVQKAEYCDGLGSNDLVTVDPKLGPLADNGGPTLTHALLPGSPAIDAIPPPYNGAPDTDQRGFPRPYALGGFADIGAVEMQFAYSLGDVDGDGGVSLLDVVLCGQIAQGIVQGTSAQRGAADMDRDGDVDWDDVSLLAEYLLISGGAP